MTLIGIVFILLDFAVAAHPCSIALPPHIAELLSGTGCTPILLRMTLLSCSCQGHLPSWLLNPPRVILVLILLELAAAHGSLGRSSLTCPLPLAPRTAACLSGAPARCRSPLLVSIAGSSSSLTFPSIGISVASFSVLSNWSFLFVLPSHFPK